MPLLSEYLSSSCKVFKAGQVAKHLAAWQNITKDKEILAYVQGVEIDLTERPLQHTIPKSKFQPHEFNLVDETIDQLIEKEVVKQVPPTRGQYVSKIFLQPKADGSHRLILNLKKFNESVLYRHFKMDSIHTITKLVERNCYMAALDLKDAYYSIPVKGCDQKYLQFEWQGQRYQFTCLPNGLSSAPRTFTKILKPVLATLHTMGHIYIPWGTFRLCTLMTVICRAVLMNNVSKILLILSYYWTLWGLLCTQPNLF